MRMAWLRKQFCELRSLVTCVFCPRFRLHNLPAIPTLFVQVADRGSHFRLDALALSRKISLINSHSRTYSASYTLGHFAMSANVRDIRSAPQIIANPSTSLTLLLRRVADSSSQFVIRA